MYSSLLTLHSSLPREAWAGILSRPRQEAGQLREAVSSILEQVRQRGDAAVRDLERQFDKAELADLQVSEQEMDEAQRLVSDDLLAALQLAHHNLRTFHAAQRFESRLVETQPGVVCWQQAVPIERVGLYVPGGRAPLFSTVLITIDNRRVIIPNGSVVGSTIVNYSSEDLRRVDLEFATGKGEIPADIQKLCLEAVAADPRVLKDPAPFARLSGATNEASKFTVRAWCKNADYWDVYFDLIQEVSEAMGAANVSGPAVRITGELAKRMQ